MKGGVKMEKEYRLTEKDKRNILEEVSYTLKGVSAGTMMEGKRLEGEVSIGDLMYEKVCIKSMISNLNSCIEYIDVLLKES